MQGCCHLGCHDMMILKLKGHVFGLQAKYTDLDVLRSGLGIFEGAATWPIALPHNAVLCMLMHQQSVPHLTTCTWHADCPELPCVVIQV